MSAYRELLDRYVERYNAGDLDGVLDLYAEDAVQIMPDGMFEGSSAIHERLARELEGFPDVHHTARSFIEQGDAFADEWTFAGTHTGPVPAAEREHASSDRQVGGDQGNGSGAGAAGREDRPQQPVLRQPGRRGAARSRPRRRVA